MSINGWLGGLLLSICGVFEVIRSHEIKRCDIGWGMLSTWWLGEILLLIYVSKSMDMPLILNYTCNLVFVSILIFYKIMGK